MKSIYKFRVRIFLAGLLCLVLTTTKAQQQDSIIYPVVVQFQSVCCGVPSDTPVRSFIKSFKTKYKIKTITAWHIGPMGKEGEYWLAFSLKELNKKQATVFARQIKAVAEKLKDRGSAVVSEKMEIIKSELPARSYIEKLIL